MTHLSTDAERLAAFLEQFKTCGHQLEDGTPVHLAAAVLLRRIPELEFNHQTLQDKYDALHIKACEWRDQVAGLEADRDRITAIADELQNQLDRQAIRFGEVEAERDRLLSALKDLVDVMSESMGTGGWVPSPLHSSFLHAMISAKQALPPATQGSEE